MYRSSMVAVKVMSALVAIVGGVMAGAWLAGKVMDRWDYIHDPWNDDIWDAGTGRSRT